MSTPVSVRLRVNGVEHELDAEPRLLLVHALRDHLGLTGTHVGCDTSNCGACTIHLDGLPVKSWKAGVSAMSYTAGLAKPSAMPPRPWIRSASNPVNIGDDRLVPPLTDPTR